MIRELLRPSALITEDSLRRLGTPLRFDGLSVSHTRPTLSGCLKVFCNSAEWAAICLRVRLGITRTEPNESLLYPQQPTRELTLRKVCVGPRPCEKALTLDHDRTSYSPKAAFGAHTQADSSLRPNPENVILVALRLFAFSHSLGQKLT